MSKKTILIVDDDADVVSVLKIALERNNFQADQASSGMEALEKVQNTAPDAIILDIMMPQMDGFAVQLKLKENPKTSLIPVIILTGYARIEEFLKLRKDIQVTAYLEKPVHISKILSVLKEVLE